MLSFFILRLKQTGCRNQWQTLTDSVSLSDSSVVSVCLSLRVRPHRVGTSNVSQIQPLKSVVLNTENHLIYRKPP